MSFFGYSLVRLVIASTLAGALLFSQGSPGRGGERLQSHRDESYHLVVNVLYSDSPQLTRRFQDWLQREVADQLREQFGELADVQFEAGPSDRLARDS